jgi:phosphoribosylformylglycinamidine synthase
VVAIQDMGAAGLTCSAVEMGAKGDLGIELDLDRVPCREEGMTAYEMMLSESQERMLMVLRPDMHDVAEAIFRKWGLDFAVVGYTTVDRRFRVFRHGGLEADLPINDLGDQAPEYDRAWVPRARPRAVDPASVHEPGDYADTLLRILASPDMCSRRYVWEQYDHVILGNTLQKPGGDAAVVRIEGTQKALAFSVDVTPRYCEADPVDGGKQAVAECWRNLTAVGADPLAITDNLNFGNPERPEIMGELVGCIQGIGEACRALEFPVVSGNVSLYNETNGVAIPPTPTIGGVGLLPDHAAMATIALKTDGDVILLVGEPGRHLGQSIYLREIAGREQGTPPPVDLAAEKRNGDFVRGVIRARRVNACHDISDGGLLVALAEMAIAGGRGVEIAIPPGAESRLGWLYGEDQARYLLACRPGNLDAVVAAAKAAKTPVSIIGHAGGRELKVAGIMAISVAKLAEAHEYWFPAFMSGRH